MRKPRSDKGVSRRSTKMVYMDYDEFMYCYEEWRNGRMTSSQMADRLNVTKMTMSNKLNFIQEHNGNVPSFWFTKNGRNLEDILIEEQIAELRKQQEEEAKKNGNT